MSVTWEASLDDLERRLAAQGGRGRRLSPRTQGAYLADARRLAAWLEEHGVAGPRGGRAVGAGGGVPRPGVVGGHPRAGR